MAERLGALGRTEDVVFSPDWTRLAIAGFTKNKVLVIEIKIVTENDALTVHSEQCVELLCPNFKRPHGLSWIDDNTLVIANRGKGVTVVSVPAVSRAGEVVEVETLLELSEATESIVHAPGSVVVSRLNDQYFDILVCNNFRNYVSRHIVQKGNRFEVIASIRLFEHDLNVPDGIAVSHDGDLVAVSNHNGHRIDVFCNGASNSKQTPPIFSLGGISYPHGLRFAMEDRLLLVADAGAPLVHVFARDGMDWSKAENPQLSLKVIDDEPFLRGRKNPQEGGPKGLDILADGSLFVVSCEEVPIAFFDFRAVRDQLVGTAASNRRQVRSDEARMLDTTIATMKAQRHQIGFLRAELAKLTPKKAPQNRTPDQWIISLLELAARKAGGLRGKR